MTEQAATNTDRELYREDTGHEAGRHYENSLHVTAKGHVGMNVSGTVIEAPIAEWHAVMLTKLNRDLGIPLAPADVDAACEVMHDAYEAAAVAAGWETQERSRVPWTEVPEANKATMRAAVTALLQHFGAGPVLASTVGYHHPRRQGIHLDGCQTCTP